MNAFQLSLGFSPNGTYDKENLSVVVGVYDSETLERFLFKKFRRTERIENRQGKNFESYNIITRIGELLGMFYFDAFA